MSQKEEFSGLNSHETSIEGRYTKKIALIIGNSTYTNGGSLTNPVNDARAMQNLLDKLGFEVIKLENVSLDQFKKAVDNFGRKLQDYEVSLFYYAGHGIQFQGSNYLIPTDANLTDEHQIEFDCLSADRILRFMEFSNCKVKIMILDACRNNPFERSWRRSVDGQGLTFMNAPTGTLIAYATSPGSTADDGNNGKGLYTESLLRHMITPNLSIEQVFKRVRAEVETKSGKRQTPWESTSLKGEFCFVCN
ncbi:MAG: caspase family protein [Cyclobacteriaceae bacterium]|nr:caspase family protein [Cyclobacteriaceae bacterium]